MTKKFNFTLIGLALAFGTILIFAGQNPMIALIAGGLIWFMVRFLWSPPPKHKDFSDRDRLEATSRAMGGSGAPPELPTPEIEGPRDFEGVTKFGGTLTPYEFIKQQNIFICRACPDIIQLQLDRNINVCPLFWQGEGDKNISIVFMGGNPSVVGTPNEPRCGERDFDHYFDYYQNRTESERINKIQARERRIRIPLRHWTMCHNLAKKLIAHREVKRWKDYVLMEAIHCFYNKENDLNRAQRVAVAATCFNKHTRNMLLFLKPKMIVLLGDIPYELLNQLGHLGALDVCKFGRMNIEGEIAGESIKLQIPVMRHRAPNFRGQFYCDANSYEAFREFAGINDG